MIAKLPPAALSKRGLEYVQHHDADSLCVDGAVLFDFFEQEFEQCLQELGGSDAAANDIEIAHA